MEYPEGGSETAARQWLTVLEVAFCSTHEAHGPETTIADLIADAPEPGLLLDAADGHAGSAYVATFRLGASPYRAAVDVLMWLRLPWRRRFRRPISATSASDLASLFPAGPPWARTDKAFLALPMWYDPAGLNLRTLAVLASRQRLSTSDAVGQFHQPCFPSREWTAQVLCELENQLRVPLGLLRHWDIVDDESGGDLLCAVLDALDESGGDLASAVWDPAPAPRVWGLAQREALEEAYARVTAQPRRGDLAQWMVVLLHQPTR